MGRTFYLDLEGGNDAADGLSYANRWGSFANGPTAARLQPGDIVRVKASPPPIDTGFDAYWGHRALSEDSRLLSISGTGMVKMLANGDSAWTAVDPAVTTSLDSSSCKEGIYSVKCYIGAAAVAGRMAYYTLPTPIDLSGYDTLTFWVYWDSLPMYPNQHLGLQLCSDTTGQTVLYQVRLRWWDYPTGAYANANPTARWIPIAYTVPGGMSGICKSVCLSMFNDLSSTSSMSMWLDDICLVKPGGSSLKSLLGTVDSPGCGGSDNEPWYPIQSMTESTIKLGYLPNTKPTDSTPLPIGFGATKRLWKRETWHHTAPFASSSDYAAQTVVAGTANAPITYSFGWNRADMSTQTDSTWLDPLTGQGYVFKVQHAYNNLERLGCARGNYGVYLTAANCQIDLAGCSSNYTYGVYTGPSACGTRLTLGPCFGHSQYALASNAGNTDVELAGNLIGGGSGIYIAETCRIRAGGQSIACMSGSAFYTAAPCYLYNIATFYNTYAIEITNASRIHPDSPMILDGMLINDSAMFKPLIQGLDTLVCAYAGHAFQYTDIGTVESHGPAHKASGYGWTLSSQYASSGYPLKFKLARMGYAANRPVTMSIWVKGSAANGVARLRALASAGLATDTTVERPGTLADWQQMTLSFTPTSDGGTDLYLELYTTDQASSVSLNVDDLGIQGAASFKELAGLDHFFRAQIIAPGNAGGVIVLDD